MSVYLRKGESVFSYDFRLLGERYHGSTGETNRREAERVEATIKAEVESIGGFCRKIIQSAKAKVPKYARKSTGYTYMLKAGHFVKIGYSTDLQGRLNQIQTSNALECEFIFCVRGSMTLERRLQDEFHACHHRGEWFFYCGKLRLFIENFRAATAPHTKPPQRQSHELLSA